MPVTLLARAMHSKRRKWSYPNALRHSSRPDAFRSCWAAGMKWHSALSLDWRRIWRPSKAQPASASSTSTPISICGRPSVATRARRFCRSRTIARHAAGRFVTAASASVAIRIRAHCSSVRPSSASLLCSTNRCTSAQHALATFVAGVDHVYLTFCLDVLPAPIAPGVSAPAVRGVGLDIVEPLIDLVINSGKLRVADIAEMNPRFDIDHQTAAVAARSVARIANGVARGLG